ncbi:aspartate kinase [Thermospira aquatica]|uniref:Aspartokinase n=1 Tax=Thermospira aquatica TaxID=2828656 RepID=A0AAX3BDX0_9SPIR|nr:aspartate kinase [Thermospira aquatica]URA10431.1 aspartate kinase [Thermospira aquatica]
MALIVQKFGGTSVGDIERIKNVAKKVKATRDVGNDVVVVVSAMSGNTDYLINLGKQITPNPDKREMDMLVSTGEQISIALLAIALNDIGAKAISFNAMQVGIKTTSDYTKAKILDINTERIRKALQEGYIVVIAGFQGVDEKFNITTLGRGGSDTTAVAVAAALKADRCDIYTDVDGVYSADPRIVPHAKKYDVITFDEMLELASLGAKVLHDRSVMFAMKYNVPLRVLSTFVENEGTLIVKEYKGMENMVVSGIAKKTDEVRISIVGVPDKPGIAANIFQRLAEHKINVNMIVQSVGHDGKSEISFTVLATDLADAKNVMKTVQEEIGASAVEYDENIGIVSVVGIGMKTTFGVAAAVFEELAKNGINIEMISTSEIKISVVIKKELADEAVQVLHARFIG